MTVFCRTVFLLCWIYALCSGQGGFSFVEEDLTFELREGKFSVQGIYYFSADKAGTYLIRYPFPDPVIYGKVTDVHVSELRNHTSLEYRWVKDSASVLIPVYISDKTPVLIAYSQELQSNQARYILTSTQSWHKPLKKASFTLITDTEFSIREFSISPDTLYIRGNKKIYHWLWENFMPERDFDIAF